MSTVLANSLTCRSVSNTMTIIYVVSGFVAFLLAAVTGRGCCVMRNRLREQEEGWEWQGEGEL